MATYCTVRDVRIALTPGGVDPSASNPRGETAASLEDWQIIDAINEAEGIINTYVAKRYTITPVEIEEVNPEDPMETWVNMVAPSPLRGWTRTVAAWLATLTYRQSKDIGEDDPVRLRYNMVMGMLSAVSKGEIFLNLPLVGEDGESGAYAENLYEGKLFDLMDFGLGVGDRYVRPQYVIPSQSDGSYG